MRNPALSIAVFSGSLLFATEPNAATKRWWAHTVALATDGMRGRDTGSEDYNRAAAYVARQFARLGLEPAGTLGYFQPVPLKATRLVKGASEAVITRSDGQSIRLEWFRQITVPVRQGMHVAIDAPLVFVGTDLPADFDLKGKVVVTLATPRFIPDVRAYSVKLPPDAGASATLTVPSAEGPEPQRWPVAYSVSMTIDGAPPADSRNATAVPAFTINAANADALFQGSGHTYDELLSLAKSGKPVPSFALPSTFHAKLALANASLSSDNILAVLPGSDSALKDEYVLVSAHLDGYGIGEPWNRDAIYNGAFDDAAYVATLIDFAERLKDSHRKTKRPILFCVFTGEEKGLLGSKYFAAHPTIDKSKLIANINLDILRPIFPLKILTVLGLEDSTLGDAARKVAEPMGIRVQPDPEPLRGLIRRSDHQSFMQIGVPSLGFVFGYEKGSPEEVIYRKWYAERYHTPADDLNQPWVPEAAAKFNNFFGRLVEAVADAAERPHLSVKPM